MTKYKCDKEHIFSELGKLNWSINDTQNAEISCCPKCLLDSKINLEYEAIPESLGAVSNVFIYDLTSGAQTELDKMLAEGYVIVNRYSKQYHIEKPKIT